MQCSTNEAFSLLHHRKKVFPSSKAFGKLKSVVRGRLIQQICEGEGDDNAFANSAKNYDFGFGNDVHQLKNGTLKTYLNNGVKWNDVLS
eukprot:6365769-Ditylum_brightwellii.AAC.1